MFRISKDRQSLYFIRYARRPELIRLDLATRHEESILTFADPNNPMDTWDISGRIFFYVTVKTPGSPPLMMAVNLADGTQRSIGNLPVATRRG